MTQDERWMREAVALSRLAMEHGNEPFGALLVKDGQVVMTNENQIYSASDPTFHAELGLLRRFCAQTGITNLAEYTLYSSCEPCFMCCGAMVWTRLGRLVYGASDIDLCRLLGQEGSVCTEVVFFPLRLAAPGDRRRAAGGEPGRPGRLFFRPRQGLSGRLRRPGFCARVGCFL